MDVWREVCFGSAFFSAMSPIFPVKIEMDFSRETFAAFSNALAALYAAPDREQRVSALLAELPAVFHRCETSVESRKSRRPADSIPPHRLGRSGSPVRRASGAVRNPAASPITTLFLSIRGTTMQLCLRCSGGLTEHERFLAVELQAHLDAVIGGVRDVPASPPRRKPEPDDLRGLGLTPRECEVLHWVVRGKRDADIAAVLGAASRTVSKHMENILRKLNVETRLAAARTAAEWLERKGGGTTN